MLKLCTKLATNALKIYLSKINFFKLPSFSCMLQSSMDTFNSDTVAIPSSSIEMLENYKNRIKI